MQSRRRQIYATRRDSLPVGMKPSLCYIAILRILSVILNLSKYLSRRGELGDVVDTPSKKRAGISSSFLSASMCFCKQSWVRTVIMSCIIPGRLTYYAHLYTLFSDKSRTWFPDLELLDVLVDVISCEIHRRSGRWVSFWGHWMANIIKMITTWNHTTCGLLTAFTYNESVHVWIELWLIFPPHY